MQGGTVETLLLVTFTGVLVAVVSMMRLRGSCPATTPAHELLFTRGATPPYTEILSLRVRYFLPWVAAPDFSGCRPIARHLLLAVRLGASVAVLGVLTMIASGLRHAWA